MNGRPHLGHAGFSQILSSCLTRRRLLLRAFLAARWQLSQQLHAVSDGGRRPQGSLWMRSGRPQCEQRTRQKSVLAKGSAMRVSVHSKQTGTRTTFQACMPILRPSMVILSLAASGLKHSPQIEASLAA
jgi:hypothetical protein